MKNFDLTIEQDGIVLITWDMPGKSMNVIDAVVMDELEQLIETVETDDSISAAILTSGKKTFGAGADLTMLQTIFADYAAAREVDPQAAAQRLFDVAYRLNLALRRLETGKKPWVAAINGTRAGWMF